LPFRSSACCGLDCRRSAFEGTIAPRSRPLACRSICSSRKRVPSYP